MLNTAVKHSIFMLYLIPAFPYNSCSLMPHCAGVNNDLFRADSLIVGKSLEHKFAAQRQVRSAGSESSSHVFPHIPRQRTSKQLTVHMK
jgi:hypothetical protein